jgi:hypothetical protein
LIYKNESKIQNCEKKYIYSQSSIITSKQRGMEDEQRREMSCGHGWVTQTQLGSLDMDIHCDF